MYLLRVLRAQLFGDRAVKTLAARVFSAAEIPEVLSALGRYSGSHGPRDTAYMRLVILELSQGDIGKLRGLVDEAILDYRDLLVRL